MRQWSSPIAAGMMIAGTIAALPGASVSAAPASPIQFAPHRAVYEITLERAASGSGVVELAGRMVYEINGSACEGYTQNMRFVTRIVSQDGSEQLNDLRTSSWEDDEGRRLRFNSEQYRDAKLVEEAAGDAQRSEAAGPITVEISRPAPQRLQVDAANMFPMQHSRALLAAAWQDQRQLVAGLYDGSEKGEKIYHTSAWIGRRRQSDATAEGVPGLAKLASWPVSIAYYEPASIQRDSLPSYELSFRIYENGVSTDMVIDYGEFSVRGELKELTYSARSECNASAGAQGAASRSRGSDGVVSPPNKP